MHCPLCHSNSIHLYANTLGSDYFECKNCSYVFKDRTKLLDSVVEKSRYDTHENNSEDQGYVDFLNRLILPLSERLSENSYGLDFGCGPGPTISKEMKKRGHHVEDYDIYYANKPELLEKQYDFVTSTEVWEHFYEPEKDIKKCWDLVKPGGHLGVMTYFTPEEKEKFSNWWYLRDETHVGFYNEAVFRYIAKELGASLEILSRQVVILKKDLS
ncbi:class I SAM-dependent methyltransferase [Halobacteriovorax sp. ZH4_bin.1]|uniref:class I SAM-dependent methyltransferase n=1 Tax=unclassified Halobacteriovorax TaxID=2639665 RepID=UPI003713FE7B